MVSNSENAQGKLRDSVSGKVILYGGERQACFFQIRRQFPVSGWRAARSPTGWLECKCLEVR
jgi:hypothetical protein